jgi:hypothetical protein
VKRRQHRIGLRSAGFTLVEVAIVLVTIGLLIGGIARGQELIQNARVRDFMAGQDAVEQAVLAFQDRFHAMPGDYAEASANIGCGPDGCPNGNGNGRVESGTDGAIHEDILAWQHLTASGFLRGDFRMQPGATVPSADNAPTSVFGGYLQIALDSTWGANTVSGHNLKTGNYVPAAVLAEVDRKIDDGLSGSGRFQFSTYAGAGSPPVGGAAGGCVSSDSPTGTWLQSSDNCGAATLLR